MSQVSKAQTLKGPEWHVVYTRPRTERIVAAGISDLGIESYLPIHRVVKQWSDRRKKLEVPLFPNYVFVKVAEIKRTPLYKIKELVKFISIDKKPVVVREKEILAMKKILNENVEVSMEEYFQEGSNVKIVYGPFAGLEGVVIQRNSSDRLLIKIDALKKAFSVNISAHIAEPLHIQRI